MPQSRSKDEFIQQASLSQQLAHKHSEFSLYAGCDPETSQALANLTVFAKFGIINPEDQGIKLVMAILDEKRKALFATSEKVNEITKMGLMMPKSTDEYEEIKDVRAEEVTE